MPIYNWSAIFLGNGPDMDPDDADFTAENAAAILGTYGSEANPLRNNVVDVVADDADRNTDVDYDTPSETLLIDGVSNILDSMAVFDATLTYIDGTTATITAVVMQTENGDLYLAPEMSNNADTAALEAGPIRSLTLNSVSVSTTTFAADRQQTNFACFVDGTCIATPKGEMPVEDLSIGSSVFTIGGTIHKITRLSRRRVSLVQQLTDPRACAVRIEKDALGTGWPNRTLLVSQQHRLLLRSPIAQRMFGSEEVLVAAKKLTCLPGITLYPPKTTLWYHHFALDTHQIVFANGAPTETLLLGPQAQMMLSHGQEDRMSETITKKTLLPARPIVEGRRLQRFLYRMRRWADRRQPARG